MKITVVYDNIPYDERLKTGWGYSAYIEGLEKNILFDTGAEGPVLLSNMERLGIDVKDIDIIFLSHIHGDHTAGLDSILEKNKECIVYFPESFPEEFKERIAERCREAVSVKEPVEIFDGVWSTGELGTLKKEQSLVIDTDKGLILIAGCAHPGIVRIVKHVKRHFNKDVLLLMGGFHLEYNPAFMVKGVISKLKKLGVRRVAPSHCTGEHAIEMFREAWGEDFVDLGCGANTRI